jgi:hypothetical protein
MNINPKKNSPEKSMDAMGKPVFILFIGTL